MIVAQCTESHRFSLPSEMSVQVSGVVNDDSFGDWYLIGIGCGFMTHWLIVRSSSPDDAIDALADSDRHGHWIRTEERCDACQEGRIDDCECARAGNASERVNLDDIRILCRAKVNFFAPADTEVTYK